MVNIKFPEWWFVIVSFCIMFLSSIPNLAGHFSQNSNAYYIGTFFNVQDYAVYITNIDRGAQGYWTYQFRFTSEAHHEAVTRLFYVALGQITRIIRLDSNQIYEIARLFFGILLLWGVYELCERLFPQLFWRKIAFLLATLGSGMGWIQFIVSERSPTWITPIDFWFLCGYIFWGLMVLPHFSFTTWLILKMILIWLDILESAKTLSFVKLFLFGWLSQMAIPLGVILAGIAMLGTLIFSKPTYKKIIWLGLFGISQMPFLMYNLLLLQTDSAWSQFFSQNLTLTPSIDYLLWGYGFFWPLILPGCIYAWKKQIPLAGGLALWVVLAFALAYLPVNTQRRFLHAVNVPMALLAILGWQWIISRWFFLKRKQALWLTGYVGLTMVTTFTLVFGYGFYMASNPTYYFYNQDVHQGLLWLKKNANTDDIVFSTERTSQIVAIRTGIRLYFGHPMETLHYETKKIEVTSFFSNESSHQELPEKINWVIYNKEDEGSNPSPRAPLSIVYITDTFIIYQVIIR